MAHNHNIIVVERVSIFFWISCWRNRLLVEIGHHVSKSRRILWCRSYRWIVQKRSAHSRVPIRTYIIYNFFSRYSYFTSSCTNVRDVELLRRKKIKHYEKKKRKQFMASEVWNYVCLCVWYKIREHNVIWKCWVVCNWASFYLSASYKIIVFILLGTQRLCHKISVMQSP